ncbi:MAG: lysophospholipid acyltransferase family protein [Anaerolineae bacterium]|nr:lysophospholipid acyltransferase family protein [Anaerolineae bacterium]
MSLNYYLYRLAGFMGPQFPAPLGYTLCRWCGSVAYQVNKPVRATISSNLRRIMGPQTPIAEIERRTRLTFNTIFYNYFDLFRLPALEAEAVDRLVTVIGWEHVSAALAEGKGIVMTSAHLGNIEVVLYAMLRRGLSITIPVERVEPPELFAYITALRTSHGLKLIPVDGPLIDLIRTLKKQGVAGLAADRDITGAGQIVPFFGYPARLPDGHIRLALRTGAPLVMGFSRRNPDQRYEAYFLPPYHPPASGSEEERVAAGMKFILAEMEKAIAQTPEQWTVTVPIWTDPVQPSL